MLPAESLQHHPCVEASVKNHVYNPQHSLITLPGIVLYMQKVQVHNTWTDVTHPLAPFFRAYLL